MSLVGGFKLHLVSHSYFIFGMIHCQAYFRMVAQPVYALRRFGVQVLLHPYGMDSEKHSKHHGPDSPREEGSAVLAGGD